MVPAGLVASSTSLQSICSYRVLTPGIPRSCIPYYYRGHNRVLPRLWNFTPGLNSFLKVDDIVAN